MGPPRLQRDHRSARQLPPQTFEERAFVVAFCGKGRYNVDRAAEVCGITERRAWDLYSTERVRRAINHRLKSRSLSAAAIEAELSDMGAAEEVDPRARVKAIEILAKVKGIGRDKTLILLERFMLAELAGRRAKLAEGTLNEQARLARDRDGERSPRTIDVSPVRAESALASGLELQDAAREREALTKEAQRGQDNGAAGIAAGPTLSAATQLALPLSAPRPQQKVDEPRSAVPSPDDDLLTR